MQSRGREKWGWTAHDPVCILPHVEQNRITVVVDPVPEGDGQYFQFGRTRRAIVECGIGNKEVGVRVSVIEKLVDYFECYGHTEAMPLTLRPVRVTEGIGATH